MTQKKDETLDMALEALEPLWNPTMGPNHPIAKALTAIHSARAEQPAPQQEPVAWRTRAEFEKWAASYSTFSLERDDEPSHGITGYKSVEQTMMWHAWQAAKTKAPEGASGGESGRETRLDLAGDNYICTHKFFVQPSSGIRLCMRCGLSEIAARKKTLVPLTDERIQEEWFFIYDLHVSNSEKARLLARAIEAAHGVTGEQK